MIVLLVGLYECKVTTALPRLTIAIMFKNILRTFEAEMSSKYLRTFNLSPKTRRSYKLEVITDQCSASDLIKKIEVLAAGMELDFFH